MSFWSNSTFVVNKKQTEFLLKIWTWTCDQLKKKKKSNWLTEILRTSACEHAIQSWDTEKRVRKLDYLCIQEIQVLTKSCVRTYARPLMLADVKCLTSVLFLTWYCTSMLWSIDNCQKWVTADQCYMTVSRAQVYNSLTLRVFKSSPLTSNGIKVIAGSEIIYIVY